MTQGPLAAMIIVLPLPLLHPTPLLPSSSSVYASRELRASPSLTQRRSDGGLKAGSNLSSQAWALGSGSTL